MQLIASITFNHGDGGNEFLEKFLKLTQIRDFGRLMTVHSNTSLYCIMESLAAISRCNRWHDPESNRKSQKV